jgi:hypothetical protein
VSFNQEIPVTDHTEEESLKREEIEFFKRLEEEIENSVNECAIVIQCHDENSLLEEECEELYNHFLGNVFSKLKSEALSSLVKAIPIAQKELTQRTLKPSFKGSNMGLVTCRKEK